MTASKLIMRNKMKDCRLITEFLGDAAEGCVIDGHQEQHHQGCEFVCVSYQKKQERQNPKCSS